MHVFSVLIWAAALLPLYVVGQTECLERHLSAQLQAGCASRTQFCESLLSSTTFPGRTRYLYETKYLRPLSTHTYTENFVSLTTVTKTSATLAYTHTLTTTVGLASTTVAKCHPLVTCGAVAAPPQRELRGACSCILGTPTTTITSTLKERIKYTEVYLSTSTVVEKIKFTTTAFPITTKTVATKTAYNCVTAAPPQQTCHNKGHQYALYNLREKDVKSSPLKWDLDYYKKQKPFSNGTASLLGSIYANYYAYEDGGLFNKTDFRLPTCNNYYINDRGYVYAPQSGTYQFHIPAYLQAAFIWVGDIAYKEYNVSNALVKATGTNNQEGGGPFNSIYLVEGQYYPFRVAYRCLDYPFDFYMNVIQPDGNYMIGEYTPSGVYPDEENYNPYYPFETPIFSKYVVQFGCGKDAQQAPEFPDWGS